MSLEISGAKTEDYSRIKMTEVQNRTEEKQIENILLRKDESIEFKLRESRDLRLRWKQELLLEPLSIY